MLLLRLLLLCDDNDDINNNDDDNIVVVLTMMMITRTVTLWESNSALCVDRGHVTELQSLGVKICCHVSFV